MKLREKTYANTNQFGMVPEQPRTPHSPVPCFLANHYGLAPNGEVSRLCVAQRLYLLPPSQDRSLQAIVTAIDYRDNERKEFVYTVKMQDDQTFQMIYKEIVKHYGITKPA